MRSGPPTGWEDSDLHAERGHQPSAQGRDSQSVPELGVALLGSMGGLRIETWIRSLPITLNQPMAVQRGKT